MPADGCRSATRVSPILRAPCGRRSKWDGEFFWRAGGEGPARFRQLERPAEVDRKVEAAGVVARIDVGFVATAAEEAQPHSAGDRLVAQHAELVERVRGMQGV